MKKQRERVPTYRIIDIFETKRPQARLVELGPQALSNSERLAILCRVGAQGENAVQVGQKGYSTASGSSGKILKL